MGNPTTVIATRNMATKAAISIKKPTMESFDLEGVDVALNSHVNIFNLLAVFLYDFPPNWIVGPQFTLLLSISCFRFDSLR